MLAGLSPARRRFLLTVAVLLAVVAGAAVVAGVVLSRAGSPAAGQLSQARPGPVLLVPGYGGSTASLRTLADRLAADGRDATVVDLPGGGTGDLAEAADALGAAADAALSRTGAAVVAGVVLSRAGAPAAGQLSQERPGPVLLVPGYGGSTASLRTLADRLAADGRDATVVDLPGGGTGDLAEAADALGAAADAALSRTGAGSVDVVGYSAGGIVARLWVADGGASLARRVVTLGSPHHGTELADLAGDVAPQQCPIGCRQLGTDSDVLARLNAGDETPAGPTWVSIWTTQDRTVTPPDTARLEGALNLPVQSVCAQAQVGHGDLPRDAVVVEMVVAVLAAGDPVALGAGDCARLGG